MARRPTTTVGKDVVVAEWCMDVTVNNYPSVVKWNCDVSRYFISKLSHVTVLCLFRVSNSKLAVGDRYSS